MRRRSKTDVSQLESISEENGGSQGHGPSLGQEITGSPSADQDSSATGSRSSSCCCPSMAVRPSLRQFRLKTSLAYFFTIVVWITIFSLVIKRTDLDETNPLNLVDTREVPSKEVIPPDYHFAIVGIEYTGPQGRKVKKIKVVDKSQGDKPVNFRQFLDLLKTNPEFLDDFADNLRRGLQSFSDMDMTPYFFETPPVTIDTWETQDFEFVLIAAREFLKANAERGAFEKYFSRCRNGVIAFPSISNDAQLIVPCPPADSGEAMASLDNFAHLANFVRTAEDNQIRTFWKEVAEAMTIRLHAVAGKKLWLSTCGLGIFWVHARIDSYPKYYTYEAYRDA